MSIQVLYEDNHLIAVFKPAGVLSQGDKSGDVNMYEIVKDYIRIKKGKPSLLNPGNAKPRTETAVSGTGVFLGLLHRLDRPVSGIMLFAKTSKGASRLSEQFRNHTVEKIYHAVVIGRPEKEKGILTNFLIKDEKLHKGREHADGKEAKLYYEVIKVGKPFGAHSKISGQASQGEYSLLKIKIEGGKFHQIRAQLSLAGFPILGDVKYKAKEVILGGNIALCATSLSFRAATAEEIVHPVKSALQDKAVSRKTGQFNRVKLSIEIPKEWNQYIN